MITTQEEENIDYVFTIDMGLWAVGVILLRQKAVLWFSNIVVIPTQTVSVLRKMLKLQKNNDKEKCNQKYQLLTTRNLYINIHQFTGNTLKWLNEAMNNWKWI